jgi:hypothetical protein
MAMEASIADLEGSQLLDLRARCSFYLVFAPIGMSRSTRNATFTTVGQGYRATPSTLTRQTWLAHAKL